MAEIKIIWEDDNIILLNKPAGLVTTKERENEKETLEDYLKETRPNGLPRNGILHRLDKGTSGLVLTAKNEKAFDDLKNQFKLRTVKKKYYALVGGDVSFEGEINLPTGRSKYEFGKFAVNVDGKNALTKFRVIKKYKKENKIYSLLNIDLMTGRTHQIRVHLSHLRWPLVGDKLYGGDNKLIQRPFLHAYQISFMHPIDNKEMCFEIELPKDLLEALKQYEEL
jgi:23S rRNA pseudouridine1911/1915/1917 synthase